MDGELDSPPSPRRPTSRPVTPVGGSRFATWRRGVLHLGAAAIATRQKTHTRQCQAYEAAFQRRRRGKSRPDDAAVLALGRQCSNKSHSGTRRESTPREATMSAPVAPPAPRPPKAKASTRKGVDKAVPSALPPSPEERHRVRAVIALLIWLVVATFNAAIMSVPLDPMAPKPFNGIESACAMVAVEVLFGMVLLDSMRLTHMILPDKLHGVWRFSWGFVSFAFIVVLIGLEVALGDMRDVAHQSALLTAKALAGGSEDASAAAAFDALMKDHAWISLWMQRGFGVILPVTTIIALMPLEKLLQPSKRQPKQAPAPAPASPRTEEEPIGVKIARWPAGGSTHT